ncbi:unnamed protein product, partial [Discosporangium mesarthrocarpum]
KSSLVLVDLAGSERAKHSMAQNQRMEELRHINLSLSALGNCVAALAQGRPHVPFRDSKLTRLLQQSLGGNACTALVVTVPPTRDEQGETLSTLQFAQRALSLGVKARVNILTDFEGLSQELQRQLDARNDEATRLEVKKGTLEQVFFF